MEGYYYLDKSNQQRGPVALEDLASLGVTKQTMVWKKGMANWQAAGMVPEVIAALSASPTPIPPPTSMPPSSPEPTSVNVAPSMGGSPFPRRKPSNNLVWAIISTVACCIPFGIVSIVYAAKVDGAWNAGDYEGAESAAKNAATFAWIAFGAGLLGYIMYGVLFAIGVASEF